MLPTAFLRAWVHQHYDKDEDDTHAENDRRDAKELKRLARVGVECDFKNKRDRKKH
jgi:hypothetical protein